MREREKEIVVWSNLTRCEKITGKRGQTKIQTTDSN